MPSNRQLDPGDAAIVTKALTGQSLSPQEITRLTTLATTTPPADARYEAVSRAYAAAKHAPKGLPSAGGSATPVAPPAPSPTEQSFAGSLYATPNVNANPPGTGAPTLDFMQGVGNLISNPANTGPAEVFGAQPTPLPVSPAAAVHANEPNVRALIAAMASPEQSVAANIHAGKYAGNAAGQSGGAAAPDNVADVAATTGDQGGLLGWLGAHKPTLDFIAPGSGASGNGDPESPAAKAAALANWQSLQDNGGVQFGGQLAGMHGIVHPDPGAHFDPTTQLLGDYSGYTFNDKNEAQRNLLFSDPQGPSLEALALAQQAGGGSNTATMMSPYVAAAMMLAGSGALAGGSDPTAMSGPADSANQLKAVEDFMRQINAPGGQVDPNQFTQDVLTRLAATPTDQFAKLASLGIAPANDTTPLDDQITATNNAMKAAGQLAYAPDAQQQLAKVLDMAQIQYKQMFLADPNIQMSYPAYLQTFIPQMFGGTGGS